MHPFTLLLPLLGLAAAAPPHGGTNFCKKALQSLGSAQQTAEARQYCSSRYPVGPLTVTKTSTIYSGTTTAVVTSTTSITTITSTQTSVTTTTSTVSCGVPTTTIPEPTTTAAAPTKRDADVSKPTAWSHYPANELKRACNCLQHHSTHTVTKTITAEHTSTSTTDVAGTTTTNTVSMSTATVYVADVPTFSIYVLGPAPTGGTNNNGNYWGLGGVSGSTYTQIIVNEGQSGATSFSLTADASLQVDSDPSTGTTYDGALAIEDSSFSGISPYLVYAQTPAGITADQTDGTQVTISCSITANSDNTCPMACITSAGNSYFNYCSYGLRLDPQGGSCGDYQHPFTPYAIAPTV